MESQEVTIQEFIAHNSLKLTSRPVVSRQDGLMEDSAYHFRCRLSIGRNGFSFYWSQGSGCGSSMSSLADVLDTLASDACTYENSDNFESWADDLGYDEDSRKSEKIYRAVKRQAEQLKRLLGQSAYDTLVWSVNR